MTLHTLCLFPSDSVFEDEGAETPPAAAEEGGKPAGGAAEEEEEQQPAQTHSGTGQDSPVLSVFCLFSSDK